MNKNGIMPHKRYYKKSVVLLMPTMIFMLGLVMRKAGWPFAPAIVLIGGSWLSIAFLITGIKKIAEYRKTSQQTKLPEEILYGLCFGLILFQQQYWLHGPDLGLIAAFIFIFSLTCRIPGMKRIPFCQFISQADLTPLLFWLLTSLLTFLLVTGQLMNPREFHNFYRASTYEEFLHSRYPQISLEESNRLIRKYSDHSASSKSESVEYYNLAVKKDEAKNYGEALRLYNLCIDKDPENLDAYFKRGYLKIYRLELNKGLANSAIIDFSESVRLRPEHADSYFQRGVALAYLDSNQRVCNDMRKAYSLDSTLDVSHFVRKFCPGSSN